MLLDSYQTIILLVLIIMTITTKLSKLLQGVIPDAFSLWCTFNVAYKGGGGNLTLSCHVTMFAEASYQPGISQKYRKCCITGQPMPLMSLGKGGQVTPLSQAFGHLQGLRHFPPLAGFLGLPHTPSPCYMAACSLTFSMWVPASFQDIPRFCVSPLLAAVWETPFSIGWSCIYIQSPR